MNGFLGKVMREKVAQTERSRARTPLNELLLKASSRPPRDFKAAVAGGGRIIAEIKRRSPSVTAFRQQGDVTGLAGIYATSGAAAISIVIDEPNFGTSVADLERVRESVTLPVLAKDFILDEYQVAEARAAGADALLLIVRILDDARLRGLLGTIRDMGMSALVECHDADEVSRAVAAGADLIGINNRNLDSMSVSVDTCRRLVGLVPESTVCVAESGISRYEIIEELSIVGVDAFLIGGALLNAEDPAAKLKELCGDGS